MSDSRDAIQDRLLSNIDDSYNKSEGEFIYDVEKTVAIELESAYVRIDGMLDKRFADTASGKDLDRVVNSVGIYRKLTTQSSTIVTITGAVGAPIVNGEKVSSDSVNFVFTGDSIIPKSGTIDVEVRCEKYGTIGNVPIGAIKYFPKTLAGLQTVTNKEAVTNGYNEETDDELRQRYYAKIQTPPTSGNKYHYEQWALEITGVGAAKCIPEPGNVKVIIVDSNRRAASQELVQEVYNHIDDVRPVIAGILTVASAKEKSININAEAKLVQGYNLGTVQGEFADLVNGYLKSIPFDSKNTTANYISVAKIGDLLFNTTGVIDCTNVKINDVVSNISLADDEIAVLGTVSLGVMS